MTGGEPYAAHHKNIWDYSGWVERLLPAYAVGLQKALCILRHPGTTRHERARAAADAIGAIVAVRALLDAKPKMDPTAATLRDFDPTACACIRQLAQELAEYAVPAALAPGEQEAADLRLALLLAAEMPPLPGGGPGPDNPQDAPPALESLQPAGQSHPLAPRATLDTERGRGAQHWLSALADDLLDEHVDREEDFSEGEGGDSEEEGVPDRSSGKKEVR
jgi:hypothetical protein